MISLSDRPTRASRSTPGLTVQRRQHRGQWIVDTDIGVPIGGDDQDWRGADLADDMAEQREGRVIGPVEIVEHDHDRRSSGERSEQRGHRREQHVLIAITTRRSRGYHARHPNLARRSVRVVRGGTALLTTLAEQQPVVVVLDDLHWADRGHPPAVASHRRPDQCRGTADPGHVSGHRIGVDDPLTSTLAALRREPASNGSAWSACPTSTSCHCWRRPQVMTWAPTALRLARRVARRRRAAIRSSSASCCATSPRQASSPNRTTAAGSRPSISKRPVCPRVSVRSSAPACGASARTAHRVLGAAAVVGRDFDAAVVAGTVDLDADTVVDILEPAMSGWSGGRSGGRVRPVHVHARAGAAHPLPGPADQPACPPAPQDRRDHRNPRRRRHQRPGR